MSEDRVLLPSVCRKYYLSTQKILSLTDLLPSHRRPRMWVWGKNVRHVGEKITPMVA
jgi:hypothetical protein